MRKTFRWSLVFILLFSIQLQAQTKETIQQEQGHGPLINRAVSYGIGYANIFDTYLSPQEYKGIDFRILRESFRMTSWMKGNLSMQNLLQANISYTHNRVDNNNTLSGLVNWNIGLHYQFHIDPTFKILAGALLDTNLGFVYNLRNGNNPASAILYINLAPSALAIWRTKIKNYPIILRYQVNVPLIGAMFSPHYGQSYYEIFSVGNNSGVVRFTSLHNQPAVRQFLSVDLPLKKTTMRLSYICDIQQSKVNHIKTHAYTYNFMVGFVTEMYKMRPSRTSTISPQLKAY